MLTTVRFPGQDAQIDTYSELLRTHATDLVADVRAIAESSGTGFTIDGADDDHTRLVIALTLLAAGLPIEVVAEYGSPLRSALTVLDEFAGVERYLLLNGLTVSDFHTLRDRLGITAELDY